MNSTIHLQRTSDQHESGKNITNDLPDILHLDSSFIHLIHHYYFAMSALSFYISVLAYRCTIVHIYVFFLNHLK